MQKTSTKHCKDTHRGVPATVYPFMHSALLNKNCGTKFVIYNSRTQKHPDQRTLCRGAEKRHRVLHDSSLFLLWQNKLLSGHCLRR